MQLEIDPYAKVSIADQWFRKEKLNIKLEFQIDNYYYK